MIQGHGNVDNLAKVTEFSLKYSVTVSGPFFEFKLNDTSQASFDYINVEITGKIFSYAVNYYICVFHFCCCVF